MANQYTKLFINNQEVDLNKSEALPLNITRRVNSIDGDVKGDFSRVSVTVPASKNNIEVLGEKRASFDYRIEVDGAPDINGTAQIKEGKKYSQGYEGIKEDYQLNLISNNSSWMVQLGGTTLDQLTDLSVLWIGGVVAAGFLAEPLIRDFAFTFVKLKEWEHIVGVPPNIRYRLSYFEATPCLYIKPLIVAAFNSIGWTVKSDWLDTDLGQKLILPTFLPEKMPFGYNEKYLNTKVSLLAPIVGITAGAAVIKFDSLDQVAPSNPTAYNLITGIYTCPLDGYYELKLEITFPLTPFPLPTYDFGAGFVINASPPTGRMRFVDTGPTYPAGRTLSISTVVKLVQGDTVLSGFGWNSLSVIDISAAVMTITGEATPSVGFDIDFKFLLEGLRFNDMLGGYMDMFNLSFEGDNNKKEVTIEPKDAYVNTEKTPVTSEFKEGFYTSEIKDYSQLIDRNKKGRFQFPPIEGRHDFKYRSDDDPTADWIEGTNDQKIYEARFEMGSGSDKSKVKTREVRFFHKTIHLLDDFARYPDTNKAPQFPLIYPQNEVTDPTATEARTKIASRILYFAGQRFGGTFDEDDGVIELHEVQGVSTKNPLSFMVNFNDTTGLDPNLGFDNRIINDVESVGLMQRYHLQDLVRLDLGQVDSNYVKFNSVDNFNFTFRTKAYRDGQRFIVQQIEGYNPLLDDPSNFKLLQDAYPTESDVLNIQNSNVTGFVTTTTI